MVALYVLYVCLYVQCWGWEWSPSWISALTKHTPAGSSSRTSHAQDRPAGLPEADRQFQFTKFPFASFPIFSHARLLAPGATPMPPWHRGAGPRHRGKQTVGHWKVRTLSATWDRHFKRCWWGAQAETWHNVAPEALPERQGRHDKKSSIDGWCRLIYKWFYFLFVVFVLQSVS